MEAGLVRGVRTALAGLSAALLAVGAHALADGCVHPSTAAVGLLCCLPAAHALTGRERRARSVLGWLAAVQVATHLVLSAGCADPLRLPSSRAVLLHAGAVAATAVLLARGDAGLWAARRLRRALGGPRPLAVHSPPVLPRLLPALPPHRPVPTGWSSPSPARRGPPVSALSR